MVHGQDGSFWLCWLQSLTYSILLFNVYIVSVVAVVNVIKNSLFVVMVVRIGKISISVSIKNGKYRGNIVSNEKAGIAHCYSRPTHLLFDSASYPGALNNYNT